MSVYATRREIERWLGCGLISESVSRRVSSLDFGTKRMSYTFMIFGSRRHLVWDCKAKESVCDGCFYEARTAANGANE